MRLARHSLAIAALTLSSGALAQTASAPSALEPLIEGRVSGDVGKRVLSIDLAWPSGLRPRFPRDETAIFSDRMISQVGTGKAVVGRIDDQPDWAGVCQRDGCRLTYSVDFGKGVATDRRGDRGFEEKQGIILAPLGRWLVRPEERQARGRLSLDFFGGKDFDLVSGAIDSRVNHLDTDLVMMDGPHVVLGGFTHKTIDVTGGRIDVAIGRGARGVKDEDLLTWVREGAQDVVGLLGRFPLTRLQVIVGSGGPYAVGSAVTMGMGGASIFVVVGERTRKGDLVRDWVMTHEMLHVAFPNMGSEQRFLEEGLSTYLEPLLRARRGRIEPATVWATFVRAMPKGLPKAGDRGLDRTLTWGRRYWGGALFWLYVDLEIRKRTAGSRSLDDVLRATLAAGGTVALRWDMARLAKVAEDGTGTTALRDLYDEWSQKSVGPDLSKLWSSLGVVVGRDRITLDDDAPLADLRRGLTAKDPASLRASSRTGQPSVRVRPPS